MLNEHGEALEADLQRFYGIDLADLWRRKLTIRKVAVLALNLPPEAAIYRQGPDDRLWSMETQFLATIFDLVRSIAWAWSGAKGPGPQPIQRPGDTERSELRGSAAEEKMRRWQARASRKQLAS